tara:strand:- start:402 stop:650 length:249 start_codon:yes stop_codon:yes gene_type:complete
MYKLTSKEQTFYKNYYGTLTGATITKATMSPTDDEGYSWPTFNVTLKDGTKLELELSKDEEGNGPGFMFGLPTPKTPKLNKE